MTFEANSMRFVFTVDFIGCLELMCFLVCAEELCVWHDFNTQWRCSQSEDPLHFLIVQPSWLGRGSKNQKWDLWGYSLLCEIIVHTILRIYVSTFLDFQRHVGHSLWKASMNASVPRFFFSGLWFGHCLLQLVFINPGIWSFSVCLSMFWAKFPRKKLFITGDTRHMKTSFPRKYQKSRIMTSPGPRVKELEPHSALSSN